MTVFRPRRRVAPLVLGLGALALVAVIIGVLLLVQRPALPADPRGDTRTRALEVAQGLELVEIEYPKVLRGEPSGAVGALDRAGTAFAAAQPAMRAIDVATTDSLAKSIERLRQRIADRAPADEVQQLAQQARALATTLAREASR